MPTTLLQSELEGLELIHRGKVRDVYALPAPAPADRRHRPPVRIRRGVARPDPGQGRDADPDVQLLVRAHRAPGPQPPDRHRRSRRCCRPMPIRRCMRVARWWRERLKPVPVEAIARGYLIGSRLEGLPGQRRRSAASAAGRAAPGRAPARADLHALDQGGGGRARREHRLRRHGGDGRRRARRARARGHAGDLPPRRASTPRPAAS